MVRHEALAGFPLKTRLYKSSPRSQIRARYFSEPVVGFVYSYPTK